MSASNHTTTIELSQYISTDKPTYLTDYNGDMLKIDNAIAADRDSISTAQNKANTADGKADANKTSIDTLNAQINGDPTDPSDTGLAGKVTDNSGDIDTIEALLGNGTPTTSNQTVIGAINGLEGAIAPREDGADLANSYAIGEQFARGGSLYTALTPLTAGTAFASLTLNTDYKNSDTLVEQIADAVANQGDLSDLQTTDKSSLVAAINEITTGGKLGNYVLVGWKNFTADSDGVKTFGALIDECIAEMNTYVDADTTRALFITNALIVGVVGAAITKGGVFIDSATTDFGCDGEGVVVGASSADIYRFVIRTSGSNIQKITMAASSNTFVNTYGSTVADHNITLNALEYKKIV